MRPDELENQLRARLDALGPAPRAELLHVLMLPDLLKRRAPSSEEALRLSAWPCALPERLVPRAARRHRENGTGDEGKLPRPPLDVLHKSSSRRPQRRMLSPTRSPVKARSRPSSLRGYPRPDAARLRAGRRDRVLLGQPKTLTFADLLIDCEEDRTLRAMLVGMLREAD
jgi:hypothetical protein